MTLKKTDRQKRIKAVAGRPLSSFSIKEPYLSIPFHMTTIPRLAGYLYTVVNDFFLLQFLEKFGIRHIPVLHVDHPLDAKVPFRPDKAEIYIGFINFWVKPLSMLINRFGVKDAMPLCAEFLRRIRKAYYEASHIYKFCMTTTNRPDYKETKTFKTIHALDPHLLCVPSLHIGVVVLTFSFYRDLFEKEHFTAEEKQQWNKELYDGAIAIAETVLYIKQHSVNCIPAALYMMTHIIPDLFTVDDAVKFIDDLFRDTDDISEADCTAIRSHIQFMYERLLLEGCYNNKWEIPIEHWMEDYAKETGQSIRKHSGRSKKHGKPVAVRK
jgi:hypothetical protein